MKRAIMVLFCFFVSLFGSTALAEEVIAVDPVRLDLGTVYVGSIIEGSFAVSRKGDDANLRFELTAPKWIKVVKKTQEGITLGEPRKNAPQRGPSRDRVECTTIFALDTGVPGTYQDALTVTLGEKSVRVPVTVTIKPRQAGLSRVLIVDSPFVAKNAPDSAEFQNWTALAAKHELDVSLLASSYRMGNYFRKVDLNEFDVVLLDGGAVSVANAIDWKELSDFTEKGGRLILEASNFWAVNVEKINPFLASHGLRVRDEESGNQVAQSILIDKRGIDPAVVAAGVNALRLVRVTPIELTGAAQARVVVKAAGIGEEGDGFIARAKFGKGEILVSGQPLWWHWIGSEWSKGADNGRMLAWMLTPKK